jgi:hypothetical protein
MPITKSISSLSNVKQLTGADSPQNPGSLVTYTYGPATSTLGQTVINLGFAVSTTNVANFFLFVDGKMLSLGSSNDYTFTNIQSNGTSSQVTLNEPIADNLNINASYLGVLVPNASATSILTINATLSLQPTISIATLTSHSGGFSANASGTYTPPAGTKYIKIRMVGGGGGGGGAQGTGGTPTSGGLGGTTTFGTSLLTANGGNGGLSGNAGSASPPLGGTATFTTGPIGIALQGSTGGGDTRNATLSVGGQGGCSPFGGAGGGGDGNGNAGGAAIANTGSGGGGGGAGGTANSPGQGGAAGGYIDVILTSSSSAWASSFPFSIGSAGTAGAGGTGGGSGGLGGSGMILIEEHYI